MKVGFSLNVNQKDADPGKHKFFIRLAREMKKNGIEIDSKKPDVYIHLAGDNRCSKSKLNILRLDNVVLDSNPDPKKRNKKILNYIEESDAIIYQGIFSKELHNKFLGVKDNKKYKIIPNGASPDEFLPRKLKNYFLTNCKWRPCKRLKSVLESFLLSLKMGLDSDLIVTGKSHYQIKHPRIKYLKWQNKDDIKKLLSGAISSLHLTWLDCCPNSMIESIVAGCPVIYTKSGGLEELAKDSGIGIRDKKWDFKPFDIRFPPNVDMEKVALSMLKMKKEKMIIKKRTDIYINNICRQYMDFFKELL